MSLYASYILERLNDHIIEEEHGFITYRFLPNNQMYIIDIFIEKNHRRSGLATELTNRVFEIAKNNNITTVLGTVVPSANNSTDSLKAILFYSFTLQSASDNLIIFKKEMYNG
jgi:predicted GNAT family acetyltransferase